MKVNTFIFQTEQLWAGFKSLLCEVQALLKNAEFNTK